MSKEKAPPMPDVADLRRPSAARVYDWYLGGSTNYAIDREFGAAAVQRLPVIKPLAVSNRRWLSRVVRAARAAGIEQFWDLGSGVPTAGNVHEIVAGSKADDPRVLYVDYEQVAVAHAQMILEDQGHDWADVVQADLRDLCALGEHPTTNRVLDFDRPVCVLMAAVLHFVGGGDDIPALLDRYRRKLPTGSWLAISHIASDDAPPDATAQMNALAESYRNTQNPAWVRDREEFASWFEGMELVEPGIVHGPDWRPDPLGDDERDEETRIRPLYWTGVGQVR